MYQFQIKYKQQKRTTAIHCDVAWLSGWLFFTFDIQQGGEGWDVDTFPITRFASGHVHWLWKGATICPPFEHSSSLLRGRSSNCKTQGALCCGKWQLRLCMAITLFFPDFSQLSVVSRPTELDPEVIHQPFSLLARAQISLSSLSSLAFSLTALPATVHCAWDGWGPQSAHRLVLFLRSCVWFDFIMLLCLYATDAERYIAQRYRRTDGQTTFWCQEPLNSKETTPFDYVHGIHVRGCPSCSSWELLTSNMDKTTQESIAGRHYDLMM